MPTNSAVSAASSMKVRRWLRMVLWILSVRNVPTRNMGIRCGGFKSARGAAGGAFGRGFGAGFAQDRVHGLAAHGAGEEVALHAVAAGGAQEQRLGLVLDALGDDGDPEGPGGVQHG